MTTAPALDPHQHLKGLALHMLRVLPLIKDCSADAGSFPCPACNGVLRWKKVGPKKHVHAKCATTPDCLAFLE